MNAQEIANKLQSHNLDELNGKSDSYIQPDSDGYFDAEYTDIEIKATISGNFFVAEYQGRMVIVKAITFSDENETSILAAWELPTLETEIVIDAYDNQYWTPFKYNFKLTDTSIFDTLEGLPVQITETGMKYVFKHEAADWVGWIVPTMGRYNIVTQTKPGSIGVRDYDVQIAGADVDFSVFVQGDLLVPLPSSRKCLERKFAMFDALLQVTVNA